MAKTDFVSQRRKNQEDTLTDEVVAGLYDGDRPRRFVTKEMPAEDQKAVTEPSGALVEGSAISTPAKEGDESTKDSKRGRKSNEEKGISKKIVTYSMDTAHIRQIKLISVDTGQPLSEIVDDAIEEYVRKHYPNIK